MTDYQKRLRLTSDLMIDINYAFKISIEDVNAILKRHKPNLLKDHK